MVEAKTFGTLNFSHGRWLLQLEAHVAIRVKRMFPKLAKIHKETITLTDAADVATDLEWVLMRYPLKMDDDTREALRSRADGQRKLEERVHALMSGYVPPRPFELALPLREYQRLAAELGLSVPGLLIADEVGLGKTAMGIGIASDVSALPALVVTLAHLPGQWEDEFRKFAPKLRTHILQSSRPYDLRGLGDDASQLPLLDDSYPDVIITNYHKLRGWSDTLRGQVRTVVLDEVQELRRNTSEKWAAAAAIAEKAERRIGLSVGPDSIVELRGGVFGAGWVGRIEDAFTAANVVGDASIAVIRNERGAGIESRGWVGDGMGWKTVRAFMRHACTSPVRLLHVGGDHLLVTDDHSVFRARADAGLDVVTSDAVVPGDILPVDDGSRWDAAEELPVYVPALVATHAKAQVAIDLTNVTRKSIGATSWQWQNFRKGGGRLPVEVYLRHSATLPAPSFVYYGRVKRRQSSDVSVYLSRWAYVLGFFLGDGWVSDHTRVCFAVETERVERFCQVLRDLPAVTLDPRVRPMRGRSSEVRCNHRLFATIIESSLGKRRCFDKAIPGEWIVSWPRRARMALLNGLIDSDGHVSARDGRLYYATTSPALARSLMSLLRSLGVMGGVSVRQPASGGVVDGRRIVGRRASYVVHWSGHAMRGENAGWNGARRRIAGSRGRFLEGVVRKVVADEVRSPTNVFDLEMDGHPSFVANGVLVHNSATPIYNYGGEIHNVFQVLRPGALGTFSEFVEEWCSGNSGKESVTNPKALGTYLRDQGFMIRRTRHDVGRELPPITIVPHRVESDPEALNRVSREAEQLARLILSLNEKRRGEQWQASEHLTNMLRQATGIGKAPYVAEFVSLLVESGERVVLFGWHRSVYDIWLDRLKQYHPVLYTGSESPAQKAAAKRLFSEGKSKVFIMSLRSGAGLDGLQHLCRTVVFGELDWSPQVHLQNIGRVARDGQPDPVVAYYLLASDGCDPVMEQVLGLKKAQWDGIRAPTEAMEDPLADGTIDVNKVRTLAEAFINQRAGRVHGAREET